MIQILSGVCPECGRKDVLCREGMVDFCSWCDYETVDPSFDFRGEDA